MEKTKIKDCIQNFIKGGDSNDIPLLEQTLHENYRNIQTGFFGEPGLFIFDKEKYLSLIREKTFGGIPRTTEVRTLDIQGTYAFAKVKLESETMIFHSLITLIKENDCWWVMGNYPNIAYKNQ